MFIRTAALAGLSGLILAGTASAAPLFQVDFDVADGHTAGSAPATAAAVAGNTGTRPTGVTVSSGNSILVQDSSASGQFYSGFGSGNLAVFTDTNTSGSTFALNLNAHANDAVTSGIVDISFDLLLSPDSSPTPSGNGTVVLRDSSGATMAGGQWNLSGANFNLFKRDANGTFVSVAQPAGTATRGESHRWTITLDYANKLQTLKRDGTAVISTDFGYNKNFAQVVFGTSAPSTTGAFAIDNIAVTVPEPATLAAFAVGGVLLSARRRRS